MHWFWVTMLLSLYASSRSTQSAPQSEELLRITPELGIENRQSTRQGRAMYFSKTPPLTTTPPSNATEISVKEDTKAIINATVSNITEVGNSSVIWTPVNMTEANITVQNITNTNITTIVTNITDIQNATLAFNTLNITRQDFVKDDHNPDLESRIVTEKPLSLETAFVQTRIPPNIESSRRIIDPGDGGMDTGAIAGIAFAALVLTALAGSVAFVLYRRRYLNKPQTLNDKCSNPDSSGYLDDSTIRDNSEEMYSLDNDSFLNSLEAMTIQNYWTDTVKHTKL